MLTVPKQRRRWQFSLAAMLSVMLASAVVLGEYAQRQHKQRLQQEAFRQVAKRGGCILDYVEGAYIHFGPRPQIIDCGTGLNQIVEPTALTISFADRDVKLLDHILKVRAIDFSGSQVSKATIIEFKRNHPECRVSP